MTRWRTAIVGFGRIAHGYAADAAMARYFPYASHAQVLRDHPAFEWTAVVDPDGAARATARTQWSIATVAGSVAELGRAADDIEVAVLATPPGARLEQLRDFRNLRAVLVEKPLGDTLADAQAFLAECAGRSVLVQVNFWRRADEQFRALAGGELQRLVGMAQAACVFYGNGLLNNGTHMVDFLRMLLGEVASVQRLATVSSWVEGPIEGDFNAGFALSLVSGGGAVLQPLSFRNYRENGLSIWGERGRLDVLNEGLSLRHYRATDNRAMTGEREIACDEPLELPATAGMALYRVYTNLAETLAGREQLWSPGDSALMTTRIVAAMRNAPPSGARVEVASGT